MPCCGVVALLSCAAVPHRIHCRQLHPCCSILYGAPLACLRTQWKRLAASQVAWTGERLCCSGFHDCIASACSTCVCLCACAAAPNDVSSQIMPLCCMFFVIVVAQSRGTGLTHQHERSKPVFWGTIGLTALLYLVVFILQALDVNHASDIASEFKGVCGWLLLLLWTIVSIMFRLWSWGVRLRGVMVVGCRLFSSSLLLVCMCTTHGRFVF